MEAENKSRIDVGDDLFDVDEDDGVNDLYLTFHVGQEEYGINIFFVTEIVGMQSITEVPEMSSCSKGVVNLRGQIISVIDVRLRFGMQERDYDERTCIIVVNIHGSQLGLIVDTVNEVRSIQQEFISPPPQTRVGGTDFVKGLGKVENQVVIILDASKLLMEERLAEIETLSESEELKDAV